MSNSDVPRNDKTMIPSIVTWWQARNLRSITRKDLCFLFIILVFGFLAIWSGNMYVMHLTPVGAISVSGILDELQMPRQLPDAPLHSEDGEMLSMWSLSDKARNVVSIYAPWCAPCQKELPHLVDELKDTKNLLVIISGQDDAIKTRKQLNNLGLTDIKFYMDISNGIMKEGKVTSVPTTFLVGRKGRVKERVVGYSEYRLDRLIRKAKREEYDWESAGSWYDD